jgi:hypothetical protein
VQFGPVRIKSLDEKLVPERFDLAEQARFGSFLCGSGRRWGEVRHDTALLFRLRLLPRGLPVRGRQGTSFRLIY